MHYLLNKETFRNTSNKRLFLLLSNILLLSTVISIVSAEGPLNFHRASSPSSSGQAAQQSQQQQKQQKQKGQNDHHLNTPQVKHLHSQNQQEPQSLQGPNQVEDQAVASTVSTNKKNKHAQQHNTDSTITASSSAASNNNAKKQKNAVTGEATQETLSTGTVTSSSSSSSSSRPKAVSETSSAAAAASATAAHVTATNAADFADGVFGLQLAGPMNAGGMVYDETSKTVFFTGSTYRDIKTGTVVTNSLDAQCFIGELQPMDGNIGAQPMSLPNPSGSKVSPDVCTSIVASSSLGSLFVIGESGIGDAERLYLSTLCDKGASNPSNIGFAAQVGLSGRNQEVIDVVSGSVSSTDSAIYPIAVSTTTGSGSAGSKDKYIVVASMATQNDLVTSDAGLMAASTGNSNGHVYPDLTIGGYRQFGFKYHLKLTKLKVLQPGEDKDGVQLPTVMETIYDVKYNNDQSTSIYVGGMVTVGETLVVVGSTLGSGGIFGDNPVNTMSGFVVKVDPDTPGASASQRIVSPQEGYNTHITQVCIDPQDETKFFVVGNTRDEGGNGQAPFVASIDFDTLKVNWKGIFDVTKSSADATGCAVQGDKLYVAGVAKGGAAVETESSAGGDDIFVTLLDPETGSMEWIRQIGSEKDERLAQGGGVAIGPNGDSVILFGQTTGNLYRSRTSPTETGGANGWENWSELFIMSLSSTGDFDAPLSTPSVSTATDNNDGANSSPAKENSKSLTVQAQQKEAYEEYKTEIIILSVSTVLFIFFCCCCYCVQRERRKQIEQSQKRTMEVFKYLRAFDADDIDIRRSPAGGFHGKYLNGLANGEDTSPDDASVGSSNSRNSKSSHGSLSNQI